MGALVLSYEDDKYKEIYDYLTADTDLWMKNDIWKGNDPHLKKAESRSRKG